MSIKKQMEHVVAVAKLAKRHNKTKAPYGAFVLFYNFKSF